MIVHGRGRRTGGEGPRRARLWPALTLLALLALASGCRTCSVSIAKGIEPRPSWRVAVLPLDESPAAPLATDHTLFGSVGAQGSGTVVARDLSAAFARNHSFTILPIAEARRLVNDRAAADTAPAPMDDSEACRIGRALGAELVVTGKIRQYQTTWFLFIPRSRVQLELRGLEANVDRLLWTARIGDCSHVQSERQLVSELGLEVAERTAGALIGG